MGRRRAVKAGEERRVPQPVAHFEVIGKDPQRLRKYFGELFGWEFDTPTQWRVRCPSREATGS
jgi:predicted enzyme related to lactoylglutathione lyase